MRGTASFQERFWTDQRGATLSEIVMFLAMAGVGVAGIMVLFGIAYPGLFGGF